MNNFVCTAKVKNKTGLIVCNQKFDYNISFIFYRKAVNTGKLNLCLNPLHFKESLKLEMYIKLLLENLYVRSVTLSTDQSLRGPYVQFIWRNYT